MSDQMKRAARALRSARSRLAEAYSDAQAAAIAAADDGLSEVAIARTLDVNRLTVRKWLGKPRKR